MIDITDYWKTVLDQDADGIRRFFHPNAFVRWHNSNEHFSIEEFIRANCEYPNEWDGDIERLENYLDLYITVVKVFTKDHSLSFHVTSFIKVKNDKIISIDEYWGEDGSAPTWRAEKMIGSPII